LRAPPHAAEQGLVPLSCGPFWQGISVGGSSSQEIQPASPTLPADLRTRRSLLSSADLLQLADDIPVLRRRYHAQLQRAKIQFVDPRFKLSSCRPLLALARTSAAALQQIYEAIRSLDNARIDPKHLAVAPQRIFEVLDWNECRLEQIAAHLRSLDAADSQCAWLRPLFEQLELYARVSSAGWKALAEHILSSAHALPDVASSLPIPGLLLKDYLAEIGPAAFAQVAGPGLETAHLIAGILVRGEIEGFDPELLTLAALCQDSGMLLLGRSGFGRKATRSAKQLRELHPSVGAGLIAGLEDFSTELPSLVAQHHRRLSEPHFDPDFRTGDGLGRRQTHGSRLLGITVRLLELIDEYRVRTVDGEALADRLAFSEAGRQLMHEALREDWDRSLAHQVLASLGFDRIDVVRSASPDGIRRRLDSAGGHRHEPNLEAGFQSREGRNVRASAR
jgi:hypothetical protein